MEAVSVRRQDVDVARVEDERWHSQPRSLRRRGARIPAARAAEHSADGLAARSGVVVGGLRPSNKSSERRLVALLRAAAAAAATTAVRFALVWSVRKPDQPTKRVQAAAQGPVQPGVQLGPATTATAAAARHEEPAAKLGQQTASPATAATSNEKVSIVCSLLSSLASCSQTSALALQHYSKQTNERTNSQTNTENKVDL